MGQPLGASSAATIHSESISVRHGHSDGLPPLIGWAPSRPGRQAALDPPALGSSTRLTNMVATGIGQLVPCTQLRFLPRRFTRVLPPRGKYKEPARMRNGGDGYLAGIDRPMRVDGLKLTCTGMQVTDAASARMANLWQEFGQQPVQGPPGGNIPTPSRNGVRGLPQGFIGKLLTARMEQKPCSRCSARIHQAARGRLSAVMVRNHRRWSRPPAPRAATVLSGWSTPRARPSGAARRGHHAASTTGRP